MEKYYKMLKSNYKFTGLNIEQIVIFGADLLRI